MTVRRVFAPGRVNLIGDHTDYTGGRSLAMATHLGTTIVGRVDGGDIALDSDAYPGMTRFHRFPTDAAVMTPSSVTPRWGRYVAAVAAVFPGTDGIIGSVTSDLPRGAGLSSSASLEVAVALALGETPRTMALVAGCREAEELASGVPCGLLDQLTVVFGEAGRALCIDFSAPAFTTAPVPDGIEFVVVHSGQERTLEGSDYATRRAECEAAEAVIGPLNLAGIDDLGSLGDTLRRRARHVISENARVMAAAQALAAGDARALGELFTESHRSMRDDFENSTSRVDETIAHLAAVPGVHGVRMTGGGWGGCVVAVAEPGALTDGWVVAPGAGARVLS